MPGGKRKKEKAENEQLTCKPLDTYNEILNFLENPPPWRTLCKELTPHSPYKIKNMELNPHLMGTLLEIPDVFCHFNPNAGHPLRYHEQYLPKTLVCHDMANGYHDDSFIDGTGNYDAYTFYNWAGIDIFCYFSHHLITIPPLGWINVGHAHGVKVIGTVITEWAEGIVFWDKILDSETEYQNFASALVAIATTLKFDGWLLNVENKISKPDVLLKFVQHLHRILHQAIPHAELIWYDSVTITGNLNWQNGLNEKNFAFFNACDGLFTNYSWTIKDVKQSAANARDRVLDLYIGIDVWGRNFYGGGEFNTVAAVKVAYEAGCSLAIFAPAWTHEAISDEEDYEEQMDKLQIFLLRDRVFWDSLWPYLYTRLPSFLPFQSSFCKGQGKRRRMNGEVLSPMPWYNLRHQQYQPNAAHGPHGYILSTTENVENIGNQPATKTGILRYRQSFLAMMKVNATDVSLPAIEEDDEQSMAPRRKTETQTLDSTVEQEGRSRTLKRKMKSVFRNLFHLKTPRSEGGEAATQNDVDTASQAAPGPSGCESSISEQELASEMEEEQLLLRGPSMKDMSIIVSLGISHDKQKLAVVVVSPERECLQVYEEDSFSGGSCLLINPSDIVNPDHRSIRLFHCDFVVSHSLIVCFVTKQASGFTNQSLNVKLYMENSLRQDLRVVLVGRIMPGMTQIEQENPSGVVNVYPLETNSPRFRQMQCHLLLNEPAFYVPIENSFDWQVWYYEVTVPGSKITSINCKTVNSCGPIMLGHFGLCPWDDSAVSK